MIVYVTEPQEIDNAALALLRRGGHEVIERAAEAQARAGEVEALFVRTYTQVDGPMLDKFPHLSFILRAGVGLDTIDVNECKRRGIRIINSPGANADAVAEYVVGAAVFLLRQIAAQSASLNAGSWRDRAHLGAELRGKTLGLVGCGNVARALAHKLSTWNLADIVGYDPYIKPEDLASAGIRPATLVATLAAADIVSLHVPLVAETRHLIDAAAFAQMKRGAVIINAARGGILDEDALIEALDSGHIAGVALDVLEHEPAVPAALKGRSNVLLTPHIGGYTQEADREVSLAPVRELLRAIKTE